MIEFLQPLFSVEGVVSFLTLTVLEVVLGIDNIVFISILTSRLNAETQSKARFIGLALALVMRIVLLFLISWIIGFSKPLISDFFGLDISAHDIIMFGGGLFLIYKSTVEIHGRLEGEEEHVTAKKVPSLFSAIFQIILLDMVFSFDSILTAIGLVDDPNRDLVIMIAAVIIAIIVMLLFSKAISKFINKHPTVKMLALSFLLMVGVLLVAEGFHAHVPKGYVYFAMTFSLFVEMLNLRAKAKSSPVKLKSKYTANGSDGNQKEKSGHKQEV